MHIILDMEIEPKDEPREEAAPWTNREAAPPGMLAHLFSYLADETKNSELTAWRVRGLEIMDVD
jgi:hypothetical protein